MFGVLSGHGSGNGAERCNGARGCTQEEVARRGWAYSTDEAKGFVGRRDVALIDLREKAERDRAGTIPGSVHAPYADLQDNIDDGGLIHELAMTGKMIVLLLRFRRALGHRSAGRPGLGTARHIEGGGMAALLTAGDEAG